jgi:hypothetical protein
MAGYDLPIDVTDYIRTLLEKALGGKKRGSKTNV